MQEHVADLNVPAKDIAHNLETQFNQGADNLVKLIVLMHTHKELLSKYSQFSIIMFHSCTDRAEHDALRWVCGAATMTNDGLMYFAIFI